MTPFRRARPGALRSAALAAVVALLATLAIPGATAAHPLGNFSVNQYGRIEVLADGLRLVYVLDLAELPTVQERARLDADGDGAVTPAEQDAYLAAKLAEVVPALHLRAGAAELPLRVVDRAISFPEGQAGLATTRIEATLSAPLPAGATAATALDFRNDYAPDRIGWHEIVVTHGPGVAIDRSDVPATDRSQELRAYPQDPLRNEPNQREASFAARLVPGAPAAAGFGEAGAAQAPARDPLAALVSAGDLSGAGLLVALALAAAWGAVHALSPGHGKTLVGAYLVGTRGTPRHALFLGLTVTVTHTAGVIALGLVILLASQTVVPERFYPWLSLLSGVMVVLLGLSVLRGRLRGQPAFGHHHPHAHGHDHDHAGDHHPHDHDHAHPHVHAHDGLPAHSHLPPGTDGSTITWRSLVALGVSGGLLPCPSALLALLGAVAVGRAGFGLLLVLTFSLGLAATLSGIGILFLFAGRYIERRVSVGPWPLLLRYAPLAGAAAVTLSGLVIVARALGEVRLP